MKRSTGCGLITEHQLNKTVTLAGWVDRRRDHGNVIFIDLRDQTGIMQIVFSPEINAQAHAVAETLRSEYVICAQGIVVLRGAAQSNPELPTGKYELRVDAIEIVNTSKPLPFPIEAAEHVEEEKKLTYRYLDLRRPEMLHRLSMRHKVALSIRNFLSDRGFLEIETPLLTRSSREGAREFLVPSRLARGKFYALPQSPQLYKQIIVAGGIEKYFQFARCFRDEDMRADRQPEFTQFDMEMGFANEADIQSLVEELINHIYTSVEGHPAALTFERMTHDKALSTYGSDKPDMRFNMHLYDFTQAFLDTQLTFLKKVFETDGKIGGFVIDQPGFSRSDLDTWVKNAQQLGAKGMVWIRVAADGSCESPIAKFLPSDFLQRLQATTSVNPGDVLFIIAGPYAESWTLLGRLRLEVGRSLNLVDEEKKSFLWVTDFPLFEYDADEKRWVATHHPFTAPQEGWQELPPQEIKARAYDLVLNGVELGGGSIRIHQEKMQKEIFKLIGLSPEEITQTFGFLMEALELGFPPLGGIAFGFDRLMMLMLRTPSIREVMAFPKTQSGHDPLMDAPSEVDPKLLTAYGIKVVKQK